MNARWKFALISLAAATGIASTASLGQWQLRRASQKEALQLAMESQSRKTPLDNAALRQVADPTALLHQHAVLAGTWLPRTTVFLDNRQMDGKVGFYVLTVLALENGGPHVVVQRGWLPRNFEQRSSLLPVDTPTGRVEIIGRIAPAPSKLYEPGASIPGAIRQNLDLAQFQTETGLPLMSVTIQQLGNPSEGLLRNWPAVNLGVDKHYGYAFQWFGLAGLIAGLYLWFQVVRRFLIPSKDASSHV